MPKKVNGTWHQQGTGDTTKHDISPHVVESVWQAPYIDVIGFGAPGKMHYCHPPFQQFRFPLKVGDTWGAWTNCESSTDQYEERTVVRKERVALGDGTKVNAVVMQKHTAHKGYDGKIVNTTSTVWVLPSSGLALYEEWGGTSWRRLQSLTPEPL